MRRRARLDYCFSAREERRRYLDVIDASTASARPLRSSRGLARARARVSALPSFHEACAVRAADPVGEKEGGGEEAARERRATTEASGRLIRRGDLDGERASREPAARNTFTQCPISFLPRAYIRARLPLRARPIGFLSTRTHRTALATRRCACARSLRIITPGARSCGSGNVPARVRASLCPPSKPFSQDTRASTLWRLCYVVARPAACVTALS